MKKQILWNAAFSIFALAAVSCTGEIVEGPDSLEPTLEYKTAMGRSLSTDTRAAELTPDNITGQTLTVWPYIVGEANTSFQPSLNLSYNNGTWSHGSARIYHPAADLVHFSVHPTANAGALTAVNTTAGTASFTYTVPATAALQEDLIGEVTTSTKADPVARLTYKHLLSQINFAVTGVANTAIAITDIKIGKLSNQATYTFDGKEMTSGGAWSGHNGNVTYSYDPEIEVAGQLGAGLPAGTTDGAAGDHFFGNHNGGGTLDNSHGNALMLLPQSIKDDNDAFFSFNYTITDKSSGMVIATSGGTPVEVLLNTLPIGDEAPVWKQGERYLYTIRFNEQSELTFTVDSELWNDGGSGSTQPTVVVTSGSTAQNVSSTATSAASVSFTTTGAWTSSIEEVAASGSGPLTRAAAPGWIAIDPTSGNNAGDYTIAITLQANSTSEARKALITITSGNGREYIEITQAGAASSGSGVESVAVTPVSEKIIWNEPRQMKATVLPAGATNKTVRWSSSNTSVATVNADTGVVSGVAEGTVTITATSVADGTKAGSTTITIKEFWEDQELVLMHAATKGNGINVVFCGDGFTREMMRIGTGKYEIEMRQSAEYYLQPDPYSRYADYFNLWMMVGISNEAGISLSTDSSSNYYYNISTNVDTKYGAITRSGGTSTSLGIKAMSSSSTDTSWGNRPGVIAFYADRDKALSEIGAMQSRTLEWTNTPFVMLVNYDVWKGTCQSWPDGRTISMCSLYPQTVSNRGTPATGHAMLLWHEAGGHGFAMLKDEYISASNTSSTIPVSTAYSAKTDKDTYGNSANMFWNVSSSAHLGTPTIAQTSWAEFANYSQYDSMVGVYEGGALYGLGSYRSDAGKCTMNDNRLGFDAPSRREIVRRIRLRAGLTALTMAQFVAEDAAALTASPNLAGTGPGPSTRGGVYVPSDFDLLPPGEIVYHTDDE